MEKITNYEQATPTERLVLVVIDVQNDFIDGSLAVDGAGEIIAPINELTAAVRAAGGDVVFTRDWHPEDTPHFTTWVVHCVAGTEGAAFHKDLVIGNDDIIISKGMGQTDGYSGAEGVGENGETLETIIAPRSPEENVTVLLGGLAVDYCVKATGLDTAEQCKDDQRVKIYAIRDAMRAVNLAPDDGDKAMKEMEEAGIITILTSEAKAIIERAT